MSLLLLVASAAHAGEVVLKLGTLAPQGSPWHQLLKDYAERAREASGGTVKFRIYAGGTQGDEADMVRKIGVGQLQAAMLSGIGLHDIASEALTFSVPGMMDSELVQQALPKLAPRMEKALEAKGFVVLNWVQVGTVAVFCDKPYATPEAAAEAKFFAWDGDPNAVAAFKAIGWRPVVLSATDIASSLQTGMITCITQAPAYMLATRAFERTPAMVDFPWSYLIAATVVKREAWEQVPKELRPKLLSLAREAGAELDSNLKRLNDDAVTAMKRQGLKVVKVESAPWQKAAERSWPAVRGKVVPADFFDEMKALREAARAGRSEAPR